MTPQNPRLVAHKSELRCRCGCLLAKVSLRVGVSFDGDAAGIEIRCRRCKAHAVLVPMAAAAEHIATPH